MVKTLLVVLAVASWLPNGESYLREVNGYSTPSFFKEEVYARHSWKSFFELKEANQAIDPNRPDFHLLNASLFFATNQLRQKYHKSELLYSATLRDAAVIHTNEMVLKNFFSHTNARNRKWDKPENRVKQCGPLPKVLAENIDYIYMEEDDTYASLAKRVVEHLYGSPPHRKNMLGRFTHLGTCTIIETKDRDGLRYLKSTQDFATY